MLNKRILNEDRILISWLGKYYVVNNFTLRLIELYDDKVPVDKISKELGISIAKTKKLYKRIEHNLRLREFYPDNIYLETPIKIQWKVTKKCNLRCKHCYLGELNNYEPSKELIDKILTEIINSNVMEVTLSGGECLTCKYINYITNTLLAHNIHLTIFTNGILLDKFVESVDAKYKDMIIINVSIDGQRESHEKIRGYGTYDVTMKNIKYACDKGFNITSATVVNSINYLDIIDMIIELKTIGVRHIQLSNLIIKGRANKDLLIDNQKQMDLKRKLLFLYREHPEYGFIYYSEIPDEEGKRKVYKIKNGKDEFVGNDNWRCTAGLARMTINEDGKVFCCPFLEESYLGDINNNSLKEIWDNRKRYEFLDMLIKLNVDRVCIAIKQNKGEI